MRFDRLDWARLGVLAIVVGAGIFLLSQTRSDVTDLQTGQLALIKANRQALCAEGQFTAPPLRRARENDRRYRERIHAYALFRHVLLKGVNCKAVLATLSASLPHQSAAVARTTRKILGLAPSSGGGSSGSADGTPGGTNGGGTTGGGGTGGGGGGGGGGTGGGTTGPPGPTGPIGPTGPPPNVGDTIKGVVDDVNGAVGATLCMLLPSQCAH